MIRAVFLTYALLALLIPSYAMAETSIGVVDVLSLLNDSKAAKSIQQQREALRAQFLEEISATEQELRAEEKKLQEERVELEPEAYAKNRQAYEAKLLEARKAAQEKKRQLEEASAQAMDVLRDQLYIVVQSIAKERGYELVISNKDVIAGEKSLDITEETMKRLNEAVVEIPLKLEAE